MLFCCPRCSHRIGISKTGIQHFFFAVPIRWSAVPTVVMAEANVTCLAFATPAGPVLYLDAKRFEGRDDRYKFPRNPRSRRGEVATFHIGIETFRRRRGL